MGYLSPWFDYTVVAALPRARVPLCKAGSKWRAAVPVRAGCANPFIQDGSNECDFKSNKKGKLRCKVKGKDKDTPKGFYHYSVSVPYCEPARLKLRIY